VTSLTRPWAVRIVALVLILVGGFFLIWTMPVQSPGNTQIWFAGEIHRDLDRAYERLCQSEQERISLQSFNDSGGNEYAVLGVGSVQGGDQQYGSFSETPDDVEQVWSELVVDKTFQGGTVEVWRLHLTRGREWWPPTRVWKICGIEQRE
jgi:hypothetical protein